MARKTRRRKHRRLRFRRQTAPGAAPGIVKVAPDAARPVIRVLAYGPAQVVERNVASVDGIREFLGGHSVVWINVDGLGDADTIKQLGRLFDIHSLALEDVVNVHQRAKVEPYEKHLFIVARMARQAEQLETEQVSMFLGENFLLTFQERGGDCFEPVRERIRKNGGRVRTSGPDYLAYTLIDAVIDSYFPLADRYADLLDALDIEVGVGEHARVESRLHDVRGDLLVLRRAIRPHREAINELSRGTHLLVKAETQVFLRDCYDHAMQLIELLEVYREVCADLRDYHLSIVSNRMNEVMKVLTIIATIFMPLSFVAGVYGMNFNTRSTWNMPELGWEYGYLFSLGLMGAIALVMVFYFWRKGWIGPGASHSDHDADNHAAP